jgi:hypothetical protein
MLALSLAALIYFAATKDRIVPDTHFIDEKLELVSTNESPSQTLDKMRTYIMLRTWLVRRVSDTTQYCELTSYSPYGGFAISPQAWYSHKSGDTLYFKYIRKDRFFTITKR